MHPSLTPARGLLAAVAATLFVAGCTGGNNNKKTVTNNKAAPSAVATIAAPRTPAASVALRTPTPAAAARTATPAITIVRSPTPGAATATDSAFQKAIAGAALKAEDLPSGFVAQGSPVTDVILPGQTAGYSAAYTNTSKLPAVSALIVAIGGFKDAATSTADFNDVENQISNGPGSEFVLQPVTNGPKLGDQSQSFQVSGSSSGISLGGFAIIWRRGKIDTALVFVGAPAVSSIDDAAAIAQKQDDRLKAVGQ
jgi:hypothetical protein